MRSNRIWLPVPTMCPRNPWDGGNLSGSRPYTMRSGLQLHEVLQYCLWLAGHDLRGGRVSASAIALLFPLPSPDFLAEVDAR